MNVRNRKVIASQGREMVARVYHFLRDEYNYLKENNPKNADLSPLANIRKRTAEATGVSERTITRILKEEKNLPLTAYKFLTPMANRRRRKCKVDVDELTISLMHSVIQNYHLEHKESPSLTKLQEIFKQKFMFTGCLSTLRTLLKKIGYKWTRTSNKKMQLALKSDKETKHKSPSDQNMDTSKPNDNYNSMNVQH